MRHLKELLAKDFVDGLSRSAHRSVMRRVPPFIMRDQPQSSLLRASRPIRRPPACGT